MQNLHGDCCALLSRFLSLWKKASHKRKAAENEKWGLMEELCRRFSLAEMRAATRCFTDIISFTPLGTWYKGYIDDGATVVAIKRFPHESVYFPNELQLLCQVRHPNLVPFVGFCQEKNECILVFEYMPNGALSDYLYDSDNKDALPWKQRLKICIGIARAIHYLHTGVKHAIIHRNVNCSSIVLDQNLVAKISSLGLSKMGPPALSNALIRLKSVVKGTIGYVDPEYILSGQLTEKSDVFSFGMVLLNVLCAKSCSRDMNICIEDGEPFPDMIDPFLVGKIAPNCLRKFLDIVQRCVRPTGAKRPTMGELVLDLECSLELQESADAERDLGTSTSLGPAHYHYQDISISEINDILSVMFTESDSVQWACP